MSTGSLAAHHRGNDGYEDGERAAGGNHNDNDHGDEHAGDCFPCANILSGFYRIHIQNNRVDAKCERHQRR